MSTSRFPLLLLLLLALHGCDEEKPSRIPAKIGGHTFQLELAVNDDTRRQGMMGRKEVDEFGGMVFAFTEPQILRFWMKNCLIPLDILYLDAGGRIVKMYTMPAPPPDATDDQLPNYPSRWPAQFAVELRAGTSEKLGLKEGQKVEMNLELLKRLAR